MKHHQFNFLSFLSRNMEDFFIIYCVTFAFVFCYTVLWGFKNSNSLEEFEGEVIKQSLLVSFLWPIITACGAVYFFFKAVQSMIKYFNTIRKLK